MDFRPIEETFEVYSEYAKHSLTISNKTGLLSFYLKNINLGLEFENQFSIEQITKITKSNPKYSTIMELTERVVALIKEKSFYLTTKENAMNIELKIDQDNIINISLPIHSNKN